MLARTLAVTLPCHVLQRCVQLLYWSLGSGSMMVRVQSRQEAGSEGTVSLQWVVVVMYYVPLPFC